MSWQDCTVKQFGAAGVPAPPGVTLECATYTADLDSISGAEGSIVLGAVRARSSATPSDAGPVVFTTGSDVLTIEQGGLLRSNNTAASSIGTSAIRGVVNNGVLQTDCPVAVVVGECAIGQ